MEYEIEYHRSAIAALDELSPEIARRIVRKVDRMRNDLAGDVKRLKSYSPSHRLRVGDWRVLFEVEGRSLVIHDVRHRSEAYG